MHRPWPLLLAPVLAGLLAASSAHAAAPPEARDLDRVSAFTPPELPAHLAPSPQRHNPSPFPDDGEIEFQGDGPNGWAVLGGILGAGAIISGLVSAISHAQLHSPDTPPSELRGLRQTRNGAGYAAITLGSGATVSLVVAVAK